MQLQILEICVRPLSCSLKRYVNQQGCSLGSFVCVKGFLTFLGSSIGTLDDLVIAQELAFVNGSHS
jgi:hypothetical protein